MKNEGVALITGLLLLASLTLLALTGTSGMILQRHMAGNFSQTRLALQRSEFAQKQAQQWLLSRPYAERQPDCIRDCLLPEAVLSDGSIPVDAAYQSQLWWNANGYAAGWHPSSGEQVTLFEITDPTKARWLIEELHFDDSFSESVDSAGIGYYLVVARGVADDQRVVTVTESVIARPWIDGIQAETFPSETLAGNFCQPFLELLSEPDQCGLLAWRQSR